MGCNGGTTESAYKYVMKVGGIEQDSDYPYRSQLGKTGACDDESSKFVTTVTKVYTLTGETNMANYMQSTGPLSVCLDASSWNTYTGGILSVCGKSVDHCVQAVGVDTSTGGYWKVRNSWGSSWGESGFIRLAYGQNTCDITSDPTYVDVKLV
jgi:C1A family cysteine protease